MFYLQYTWSVMLHVICLAFIFQVTKGIFRLCRSIKFYFDPRLRPLSLETPETSWTRCLCSVFLPWPGQKIHLPRKVSTSIHWIPVWGFHPFDPFMKHEWTLESWQWAGMSSQKCRSFKCWAWFISATSSSSLVWNSHWVSWLTNVSSSQGTNPQMQLCTPSLLLNVTKWQLCIFLSTACSRERCSSSLVSSWLWSREVMLAESNLGTISRLFVWYESLYIRKTALEHNSIVLPCTPNCILYFL